MATAKKRGFKTYRYDQSLTDDAYDITADLVPFAKKSKVALHPIIHPPFTWGNRTDSNRYPDTLAGIEQQGYDRALAFILKYALKGIYDYEFGNEITNRPGFKSGVGYSPDDYNTQDAREWAALLRGMSRALQDAKKATGKPLRSVVDIVAIDFGFIKFLESNGVQVDVVAYHYYNKAEMSPYKYYTPPPLNKTMPTLSLFAELGKLGKSVIINEFNAAEIYNAASYTDEAAVRSMRVHLDYLRAQKDVVIEGVEFYELYDEADKAGTENSFGLMKDAQTSKPTMALAALYANGSTTSAENKALLKIFLNP